MRLSWCGGAWKGEQNWFWRQTCRRCRFASFPPPRATSSGKKRGHSARGPCAGGSHNRDIRTLPVSALQSNQKSEGAMRSLGTFVLFTTIAILSPAQTVDKPLTNSDIQSMLAAGLPESTILLRIETAAFRGLVDMDASPAALAALKQSGAGERVLNDVIWAEPFGAAWKQKQAEDRAVPDLPARAGVYYKSPSGWVTTP